MTRTCALNVCIMLLTSLLSAAIGIAAADSPTTAETSQNRPVRVERALPTVQRIGFNPDSPPPEMPRLKGAESALTQYEFNCAVDVKYDVWTEPRATEGVRVTVELRRLHIRLRLENRIYLPPNANLPLRAHEEGHREINERVYEESARGAAMELGEQFIKRRFKGEGPDEDSAGKAATDAVVQELGRAYLAAVADRASRIGDDYDDITQHGKRPVNVARAIEMAFARERKRATTRPARGL